MADVEDIGTWDSGGQSPRHNGGFGFLPPQPIPGPPSNITIVPVPLSAALPSSWTVTVFGLANPKQWSVPTLKFRIYFISATEVAQYAGNPLHFPPGKNSGLRHYVTDVPAVAKSTQFTLQANATYLVGGWLYGYGVGADGSEGQFCPAVMLPIGGTAGIPGFEVGSPSASLSIFTGSDTFKYATISLQWTTSSTDPLVTTTKYVQIYIQNYINDGLVREGPMYGCTTLRSFLNVGSFVLECDDGTGGFANPGAHSVTLYFVSLGNTYQHRSDVTSAPSVVLASGIHS